MLQLVGLGLADETDVTVKGLELIKKAERVYLEAYTSILLVDTAKLVSIGFYGLCFGMLLNSCSSLSHSRKPTMAARSLWPTVRWLSLLVMRS